MGEGGEALDPKAGVPRKSYRDSVIGEDGRDDQDARDEDDDRDVSKDDVVEEGDNETWFGIGMTRRKRYRQGGRG